MADQRRHKGDLVSLVDYPAPDIKGIFIIAEYFFLVKAEYASRGSNM